MKLIDSFKFMSSSWSSLVYNLSEKYYNNECMIQIDSNLDCTRTKNNKLLFKCFKYKASYRKVFDKGLIKLFTVTFEFCDRDINNFTLPLRKGIYHYEYMDTWER